MHGKRRARSAAVIRSRLIATGRPEPRLSAQNDAAHLSDFDELVRSTAEGRGNAMRLVQALPPSFVGAPRFVGPHGHLNPVAGAELGHQARDVCLDGAQADVQLLRDLGVGAATGDGEQHLLLAVGQGVDRLVGTGRPVAAGEGCEQPAGDARGDERVAAGGGADGFAQQLGPGVLEEEAGRAGAQRVVDVLIEVEGGDHDHRHRVLDLGAGQLSGGRDAVEHGHLYVHQAHIGAQLAGQPYGVLPVARLADDLDAVQGAEDQPEPGAHQVLVVGDQHSDRHPATSRGKVASTAQPRSSAGPATQVPPSSAARSTMPVMPNPGPGGVPVGTGSPSSRISRWIDEPFPTTRTSTRVALRAWRRALVTASCAIRNTAASTAAGSVARSPESPTSTRGPAGGPPPASRSRSATPVCGAYSTGSWLRSMRTMARISASVREASASITWRAASDAWGLEGASARPACAWIAIAETWWATVSWSSRASSTRSSTFACSRRRVRAPCCERAITPSAIALVSTAVPPIRSATPVQLTKNPSVAAVRIMASPSTASRPEPQRNRAYGSSRK